MKSWHGESVGEYSVVLSRDFAEETADMAGSLLVFEDIIDHLSRLRLPAFTLQQGGEDEEESRLLSRHSPSPTLLTTAGNRQPGLHSGAETNNVVRREVSYILYCETTQERRGHVYCWMLVLIIFYHG